VKDNHPYYRADIDGLRALAVLSVVAFHVAPMRLTGGFVGVDIFFVISGFLISSQLFSELGKNKFSYISFYVRRIRRIFPALIAMFAFVLVAGWFLLLPDEYRQLGKHVVAGSLYVSNFVLWSEAGYFDVASHQKPLLHLWSLGVEEQFYIFWPLILALMWRLGICTLRWVTAGLLLSLGICCVLAVTDPSAAFYLPFARFWQLMAGAVLALAFVRDGAENLEAPTSSRSALVRALHEPSVQHLCSVIGGLMLAASILLVDSQSQFPWLRAVLPTLGATLVIAAGPTAFVNRHIFSRKIAVLFGLISYPLYLWHWPLLSMLEILHLPGSAAVYKMAAALLAVVLATLTYQFIEKPIRTPPYPRVRWLVVGSIVCMLAGGAVMMKDGFADARGPWGIKAAPERPETADMQTAACAAHFGSAFDPELIRERDFCIESDAAAQNGKQNFVVVGDSHANRLFFGLQSVDPQHAYLNLGRGTCIPFLGYDGAWPETGEELICTKTMQNLIARIAEGNFDTVILNGFFVRAYGGYMKMTGTGNLREQARATLEQLSKSGKRTIVMLDVPVLPFEPSTCIARPALQWLSRSECSVSLQKWREESRAVEADVRAAAADLPNIFVFDPASVLCDDTTCRAVRDNELLYMDPHHLSQHGADIVARELLKSVGEKR
jgi:peptidoglycan/LPS O-acetylase OafA/YrhL